QGARAGQGSPNGRLRGPGGGLGGDQGLPRALRGTRAVMSSGGSTPAGLAAMVANLGIPLPKFVAFLITPSTSLLAESIHSVADTGNQILLLLGGRRARKTATPLHQFGFGRERYFWAFVVAIILFTLGALFAIYEGIEKVMHPHELESPQW